MKPKLNIIFETKSGSHLYGTNTPLSDLDFRGIAITSIKDMIDPFQNFEQQIETKIVDRVIYDIRKFFSLAKDCNPNIIELLYANDSSIVSITEKGRHLIKNRNLFLSQKIRQTFMGYAFSQLKRIELHRGYLLNPPDHKPTRSEFGLPESPKFGLEKLNSVIHAPEETIDKKYREYVLAEARYRSKSEQYQKYEQWKNNRNPKRFALEEKHGYDLKHANHLFRLLFEGRELLETSNLVFPLANRYFLLSILNGAWTYPQIMDMASKEIRDFEQVKSILPKKPDVEKLRSLYFEILASSENVI